MHRNPDTNTDTSANIVPPDSVAGKRVWPVAGPAFIVLMSLVLASCSSLPRKSSSADEAAAQSAIQEEEVKAVALAAASAASSPAPPQPTAPPAPDAVTRVLAYAERVRTMPPLELNQELARLAAPAEASEPARQVQLSLVLSQLRQLPELIRGQELLARVLANGGPDAQPLHPLARLLAFRYGEQRRLEDQLEKERQQTREVQRRLDQTNERLEALKAIERSLTTRPPPPPPPAPAPLPVAPAAGRGRANP